MQRYSLNNTFDNPLVTEVPKNSRKYVFVF